MLDFLLGQDLLSAIIAFGLVLIPAVLVHEFGHFIAAKLVGITILEFGVGFPPRARKLFTWRETEVTLNWLPIGGFVRPLGEDMVRPLSEEETERDRQELIATLAAKGAAEGERNFEPSTAPQETLTEREQLEARGFTPVAIYEAKPWPRLLFLTGGVMMNFVFAFLLFVLVGLIGLPEDAGVRIGLPVIPEGSALAEAGLQPDDIVIAVDNAYIDSGEAFTARLEESVGQPLTLRIRREEGKSRQILDITLTPTEEMISLFQGVREYVVVVGVHPDAPAGRAGILAGDLIVSIGGQSLLDVENPMDMLRAINNEYAGQEMALEVLRDGEPLEVMLVPRVDFPADQGRMGIIIQSGLVNADFSFSYGVGTHYVTTPQSLGVSLEYAATRMAKIFRLIIEFPARLFTEDTEPEERRIVSPVGVSQLGGAILQDSIGEDEPVMLLDFIALISIALGFTNLLPIPALDGGRVVFVVIEMIRGKPMSPEREGKIHLMGLLFILSIGVFFIINDLLNPLTDMLP